MIFLSAAVGLLAAVMLLSTLSDALSVAWIVLNHRRPRASTPAELPKLLFLVPAHDEELLIESCVRSLLAMRYPPTRYDVVVVADNCTDRTGEIARNTGVRCLVRTDRTVRGKPHAIAWALTQLSVADYSAVVIMDADAIVDPGFAAGIAETAPLERKAVQPSNDVRNPEESAITRMAAVMVYGVYRGSFPLKQRAGLNIPLGCGMCIGRDVLAVDGWNAFSIGEDMEWYAILTARGVLIDYAPHARLYQQEAKSLGQSDSQRQRWVAGRLLNLFHRGPDIVLSGNTSVRQKLDAVAELAAIGPVAQFGLAILLGLLVFSATPPGATLLTTLLLASLVRPFSYTLVGLAHDPHPLRALRAFAFLPIYTVWRVASALSTLRLFGDKRWVRTDRH